MAEEKVKKKKKKTRVIIAVVIAVLIIIRVVSCAFSQSGGAVVTTAKAERGDLQESISTSGTVAGEEVKVLFSPVNGRVDRVEVAAGDAVSEGDLLISFDMEEMEKNLQQATLQHDKSSAAYQGAAADSAEGAGKYAEADASLKALESRIADYKAHIRELQRTLDDSLRGTGNALAEQRRDLEKELSEKKEELSQLQSDSESVSSGNASEAENPLTPEQQKLNKRIEEINDELSQNSYLQSVYSNSDYVAELKAAIEDEQENLARCEEEKAKMESQKATGESKTMDAYDKKQSAADKELAEISYEEAKEAYEAASIGIRADFDGIVTECTAVAGSAVTDGMQLLKLESSGEVKVSFNASKYDVEKLKTGQKADVTISGKVYEGEVSKINRMASAAGNSTTPMVGVEVHLLSPDDAIILGLDAKLTIYTGKAENALLIPVEAVNADKNGDFLYIVEDAKVVRRDIICGISTDTYTEVLEGITEADEIILTAYTSLEEGMPVTVLPQS
ncbi:MAG: efflux RND transporter periplasmic adaptor subunit [Bacteroidales bacterium]|nr:efflux RND transporter periplasmic adaptor subunit [Lachnoclostridium sp.]MCM1383790.1 efflux RND transporter periplasmic adaptor subunit [Lachnoclostridium sp.]MCM1464418.1 efflux RND transporter periplasmic adaptor subunit [Bacteroidales bacterium]